MYKKVIIAVVAGFLALGVINYSIFNKEFLLRNGEILFLELAPVDPRSLMQGDYMALRFSISNEIRTHLHNQRQGINFPNQNGIVVITLQDNGVGKFSRMNSNKALAENERVLQYRVRNGKIKFATNAFFFQEGTAKLYTKARYGQFRVDSKGGLLLTGLRGEEFEKLGTDTE